MNYTFNPGTVIVPEPEQFSCFDWCQNQVATVCGQQEYIGLGLIILGGALLIIGLLGDNPRTKDMFMAVSLILIAGSFWMQVLL